jgi:hypothetical protein
MTTPTQQVYQQGVLEGIRQERNRIFKSELWNILRAQGWSEFSLSQLCAELKLLDEVNPLGE